MSTSGYSGTPLLKKLGITETSKISLINAPGNYFDLLEKDVRKQIRHYHFLKRSYLPLAPSRGGLRILLAEVYFCGGCVGAAWFILEFCNVVAQRLALPAGGRDQRTPLGRNQLQATQTA